MVLAPRRLDTRLENLRRLAISSASSRLGFAGADRAQLHPVDWFTLVTEHDDDLECYWRDDTAGSKIFVLKPHVLTGDTNTRSQSGETQYIVPPYAANDIVYGIALQNGAGLGYDEGGDTLAYRYVDLNVDGRMWAADV